MSGYATPLVVLLLGGTGLLLAYRLINRYVNARLRAIESKVGNNEAAALERLNAARLAEATLEERIELEKLELRKKHAEVLAAGLRAEKLKDDRLEADRRAIVAYGEAKERLAEELVREDAAAKRGGDLVSKFERYLQVCAATGKSAYSIGDFATTLRQAGE